jgi:hypothetical protein
MVLAPIAWVTFVVIKTRVLPDLSGPALFATGGAVHGGVGKWSEIVRDKLGLNNPDQTKS